MVDLPRVPVSVKRAGGEGLLEWAMMKHWILKLAVLGAGIAMLSGNSASAQLYSNTSQTGFRFNPGAANIVFFDDVPIPVASLLGGTATHINITQVQVGIRQVVGGPATNVLVWTGAFDLGFGLRVDQLTNISNTLLPVVGATQTTLVTTNLAPGVHNQALVYAGGFGFLNVGFSLSDPNTANGIRLNNNISIPGFGVGSNAFNGTGAPNLNFMWGYDSGLNVATGIFNFGAVPSAGVPAATFFITLSGTPFIAPVPEPGSCLAVAGLGIAALASMRKLRRKAKAV